MSEKQVKVGKVLIGGAHIPVQSMLCADPHDAAACLAQIAALEQAGCEIVRLTVPDEEAARVFAAVREKTDLPLVADIHFDHRLALAAIEAGADKIRINPGNIGGAEKIKAVADAARRKNIPIRVGVNSGSLEPSVLKKYGKVCPEALCESALYGASLLERYDFGEIVISVKSSDVRTTVAANRLLRERTKYPLHIGVTEAGTVQSGIIKSAAGIGALLVDGIGDTIRVSLTADPVEEVYAAKRLLRSLGLLPGPQIISCPTCGRTKVDLVSLAEEVERMLALSDKPLTVAVMGCAVNGPGEAKNADIGLAGGEGEYLLFSGGRIIRKVKAEQALAALKEEIDKRE